jgi:hypothetical protein
LTGSGSRARDTRKGGDFADGIIAFEGRRLGGRVFASFGKEAIALVEATGGETRLLSKR